MKILKSWTETGDSSAAAVRSALLSFLLALAVLSQTENLMALRVHETLRMNLTVGFLILYAFGTLNSKARPGQV
jgi:hypothetical protein